MASIPNKFSTERPLSPPPLLLAKPAIRSRASLTSIQKMPMIREDEAPALINLPNGRSRPPRTSVFYQYGEDYITPWHLVGICPSPAPRAQQQQQAGQGGSSSGVRGATSEDSSDWEEQDEKQGGRRHGVVRTTVGFAAKRGGGGGWRRLCEPRYWSWR